MNRYAPPLHELEQIKRPKGAPANWGYCGIAAMSAATSISPLELVRSIPDWRGYTPSRMVIKTLERFGYGVERRVVLKNAQRLWPIWRNEYPSYIALGRIYYDSGKYADSHWICFYWAYGYDVVRPFLYDNNFQDEQWRDTLSLDFYDAPTKLKSLYFVVPLGDK